MQCASVKPNDKGYAGGSIKLSYVVVRWQLTKDRRDSWRVRHRGKIESFSPKGNRKMFSQWRINFPPKGGLRRLQAKQRFEEFHSHQSEPIPMLHPEDAGLQGSRAINVRRHGCWRRAGDLERNLRQPRNWALYRDHHAAGGDVESCGKLEDFFFIFPAAANKNRYGQRQSGPAPALSAGRGGHHPLGLALHLSR